MDAGLRKRRTFHKPGMVSQALNETLIFALILLGLVALCVLLLYGEYRVDPVF